MDTPPLLYKSVHVTFVFWVPKTPPTPYMSGTFVLAPPPPPPILAKHFNHLIKIGEFPDPLKSGKISPVFKKDNEELMKNYRPVFTLPIFGKIFEKVIYNVRLYNFFVSQWILHNIKFGFRKNHSTTHALNYSISQIKMHSTKKNMS